MSVSDLLKVDNLSLFKGKEILKRISFTLSKGGFLLILGPSGAGKSSLLRCLNRLDTISGGTVSFAGQNTRCMEVRQLRRRIGMVFQTPALLPGPVRDNISMSSRLHNQPFIDADVESLIQKVGLAKVFLDRRVETLSVGEQQRVALAQSLANHPEMMMLDEATSALDPTASSTIERLIQSINRDLKTAILWVTHDVAQAVRFNAQTLVLIDGKIHAQGNIGELMAGSRDETLQRFFKGVLKKDPAVKPQGDADGE